MYENPAKIIIEIMKIINNDVMNDLPVFIFPNVLRFKKIKEL